jgi:mRNA interferase MazF
LIEEKEFDKWNEIKKKIQQSNKIWTIKPREIYWVKIGKNIGYEMYGKDEEFLRPVLILKRFNKYSFLGIPLTSIEKNNDFYVKVTPYKKDKKSFVIISQIRFFSTKRIKSKFSKISQQEFENILEKVSKIVMPQRGAS